MKSSSYSRKQSCFPVRIISIVSKNGTRSAQRPNNETLNLWYSWVGSNPHLIYYFSDKKGNPIKEYLEIVGSRFGQWILDTTSGKYDREWLNYAYEIGLRHYKTKKNKTDNVKSVPLIHLRYLIAFIYPITATIKSFLAKKGNSQDEVEKMYNAWFKSVVLQVAIWSYPYARDDSW